MQTESALGGGTLLPGISFMTLLLRNNGAQSIINWLSADMFGDSETGKVDGNEDSLVNLWSS